MESFHPAVVVAGFVEESAFLGEYHTVDKTGQSGEHLTLVSQK